MSRSIPCRMCDAQITTHHGYYRAKRRGYGFCSSACSAEHSSMVADENAAMRFLQLVDIQHPDDECWPYTGRTNPSGYGLFDWGGKPWLAHRLMYLIIFSQPPGDKFVCHSCDNPICCNPGHLWRGTALENTRDMWAKGRANVVPSRGESHGMAKLTSDDVLTIRASAERNPVLAKQYGVTSAQISNIKRRKAWRHV